MRNATRFLLATALLAGLAGTFVLAPHASGGTDDSEVVKTRAKEFIAAWQKHDPKALAALWADDGDLINPWGRWAKGRAEVEALFRDEQTGKGPLRESTMALSEDSVRFPAADVAVHDWTATCTGVLAPDGTKQTSAFHVTMVWKKAGGTWSVYSARPYLKENPPGAPQPTK